MRKAYTFLKKSQSPSAYDHGQGRPLWPQRRHPWRWAQRTRRSIPHRIQPRPACLHRALLLWNRDKPLLGQLPQDSQVRAQAQFIANPHNLSAGAKLLSLPLTLLKDTVQKPQIDYWYAQLTFRVFSSLILAWKTKYLNYEEVKFKGFPEFAQDFHNHGQKYVRILEMMKDTN